jgi:hypothetical protein
MRRLKLMLVCALTLLLGAHVCVVNAAPANDNCANAQVVGDVTDLAFDTTDATFDGLAPAYGLVGTVLIRKSTSARTSGTYTPLHAQVTSSSASVAVNTTLSSLSMMDPIATRRKAP